MPPVDEDLMLWQAYTRGIKRYVSQQRDVQIPEQSTDPKPSKIINSKVTHNFEALINQTLSRSLSSQPQSHLRKEPLHLNTTQRHKRPVIERRLDLHGMTQDQAHQNLIKFVTLNYALEHRSLLVITGKGRRVNFKPAHHKLMNHPSKANPTRMQTVHGYRQELELYCGFEQGPYQSTQQQGTQQQGILQRMVPQWLEALPLRTLIIYYCVAKPKDGGSGAYYIKLKKLKK